MESTKMKLIIKELDKYSTGVSQESIEKISQQIVAVPKIFIGGAGRSGYAARGFAMRLMHLGLQAYFIGESTTPSIKEGDLLIIGSGSGATSSLLDNAKKAKSIGAKLATLTIYPDAPIGKLADVIVQIPGETPKKVTKDQDLVTSIQPMGSLFEQLSWLTYDSIILNLMDVLNETTDTMFPRHANLE
jgi:6-phospho 3-hexuloisomerase